jgi:N-acetylglucosaminyl-diphospho-decaprenol L-rhamnosyltransferase
MTNLVDAIVVAYRSQDVIRGCVDSLLADRAISTVWVVNNSPGDRTRTELSDLPRVVYTESPSNVGFGRAVNSLRHKIRQPYVVLANPDTRQAPDTSSQLLAFLERSPRAAIAAPMMFHPSGRIYRNSQHALGLHRMVFDAVGLGRWGVTRPAPDHEEVHRTAYVIGSFVICRVEALDEVEWFDERIFLFGEDQSLCRRLRHAGWEIWFSGVGEVTHMSGHSWRQLDDNGRRLFRDARRRELMAERGRLQAFSYTALAATKDIIHHGWKCVDNRRENSLTTE